LKFPSDLSSRLSGPKNCDQICLNRKNCAKKFVNEKNHPGYPKFTSRAAGKWLVPGRSGSSVRIAGKYFYALAAMMISYIFIVPQRGLPRQTIKIPTKTQQSNRTTPRPTPPLAQAAAAGLGGLGHALRGGLSGGTLGGKTTTTTTTMMQTLIGGQNASHPAPETNGGDDDDNGGTTSPMTTTITAMARGTNCHAEGGKDRATTRATMD
jgi:hypothetical protein